SRRKRRLSSARSTALERSAGSPQTSRDSPLDTTAADPLVALAPAKPHAPRRPESLPGTQTQSKIKPAVARVHSFVLPRAREWYSRLFNVQVWLSLSSPLFGQSSLPISRRVPNPGSISRFCAWFPAI